MERTVEDLLDLFLGPWEDLTDEDIDEVLAASEEIMAFDKERAATRRFFDLRDFRTLRFLSVSGSIQVGSNSLLGFLQ